MYYVLKIAEIPVTSTEDYNLVLHFRGYLKKVKYG